MNFYINGEEPAIKGKVCRGFYLIQHQEGESITDQANVAFFKFDGHWIKLHFDDEIIFWRGSESPSEPVNDRLSTCLVLLNLCEFKGVIGHRLNDIEYGSEEEHVWAKLEFSSGQTLLFKHHAHDDYTTVNC
ncbi:hypothetical protein BTA51_08240 [Hahella sp. CCB-MM4]|uniref:hypothetical protein n=1 Tax=Hahella sp. (strain CCB-MM4) TaxID=1926491 RepID=UPI000B9A96FE|nr:hypothetical protein [Hahella sp. CCB-MM4]OZG73788.1 hypothetical protein BTA51_08240 [Hahella sp. CCB-MM4]